MISLHNLIHILFTEKLIAHRINNLFDKKQPKNADPFVCVRVRSAFREATK